MKVSSEVIRRRKELHNGLIRPKVLMLREFRGKKALVEQDNSV